MSFRQNRFFLLFVGVVLEFFVTGVVYGWPSLSRKFDLDNEFAHVCLQTQNRINGTNTNVTMTALSCVKRDVIFNSIFSAGTFALLGSAVFHGVFLDKVGSRISRSFSYLLSFCGAIGFVFANDNSTFSFQISFALLGAGGLGVHFSLLRLGAKLFPNSRAMAIACLNGAFCASGYLFLIFLFSGLQRPLLFGIFATILAFCCCLQFIIPSENELEKHSNNLKHIQQIEIENNEFESVGSVDNAESVNFNNNQQMQVQKISSSSTSSLSSNQSSALEQMKTLDYLFYVLFIVLNVLQLQFFIGTVRDRAIVLTSDSERVTTYVFIANLLTPLGFVATPFYGQILERSLAMSAALVNLLGVLNYVFAAIPLLETQLPAYILWALWRGFLFAFIYAFVAKHFGLSNFGRLSGFVLTLCGVMSLLQIAMRAAIGNATFVAASIIQTIVSLCGFAFPLYLKYKQIN